MPMRGLTILVPTADGERLHAALTFAAASAAAGAETRLHLHGGAVALLAALHMAEDDRYAACGLPTLAQLFEETLGLGVAISACQSGLALCGIGAEAIDARVMMDGPVGVLLRGSEDRLLSF
jgi:predicted peroxiredoxin